MIYTAVFRMTVDYEVEIDDCPAMPFKERDALIRGLAKETIHKADLNMICNQDWELIKIKEDDRFLTPTELGKELNKSEVEINELLHKWEWTYTLYDGTTVPTSKVTTYAHNHTYFVNDNGIFKWNLGLVKWEI